MGSITLGSTPTVGNLLIAFVGCNIARNSVTLANGWKSFAISESETEGAVEWGLYRYVQSGDTTALPSFASAGNTYWGGSVQEISGVTGTWATDCHSVSMRYSSGASSLATPTMRTDVANALVLVGFAQYNGNGTSTFSSGWTSDESTSNNATYGAYGCAHQAVATAGTTLNCTVTFPGSSGPAGVIQLVLAGSQPTHYTIRQSKIKAASGTPGSINLDMDPLPGNLIVAFLSWGNGSSTNPTIGTSWTDQDDVSGTTKQMLLLYRYAVSGDTLALPALATAGSAFWCVTIHEISGTTGAWSTDSFSITHVRQASGTTLTSSSDAVPANALVLSSFSNYDGSSLLSFSNGDVVLPGVDFGDYGSWATVQKFFSTSGTFSSICTMSSSGNPQANIQLILGSGATGPTNMNVTQIGLEVWDTTTPSAQFTQIGLEVWRSTDDGTTVMVATQIGAELWIAHSSKKRRGVLIIMC